MKKYYNSYDIMNKVIDLNNKAEAIRLLYSDISLKSTHLCTRHVLLAMREKVTNELIDIQLAIKEGRILNKQ